jgi:nucleotide-binding universal stress UspA family protein
MKMFKTILLATDGSPLSDLAVQAAIDFAKTNGSKIVGLSVVDSYAYLPMTALSGGVDLGALQSVMEDQAQDSVERVRALAAGAGVECEIHTLTGCSPCEGILKSAQEHGCDGIFMASHGRAGLDKMLLGSVAQKVLAKSTIPVLIFKHPVEEGGGKHQEKPAKKWGGVPALSIGAIA